MTITPVIVVGMHRSGTSALTRVLNLLGVDLGPSEDLLEPKEDNPDGFWENRHLVQAHDDLIARMGGRWEEPPLLDRLESIDDFDDWVARCATVVEHFEGGFPGFKDPRASLLLPVWRTIWPDAKVVVCLRQPQAVALSLNKREGFEAEKSAQLWLRYNFEALSTAAEPIVVRFEDLLDRPADTVGFLSSAIGLEPSADDLDGALATIRSRGSSELTVPDSPWMTVASWLYESLREIPRDGFSYAASGARGPMTLEQLRNVEAILRNTQQDFREVRVEADRLNLLADARLRALEREERSREALAVDLASAQREIADLREEVGWRRAIQYRFEKVLGRRGMRMLSGYEND